MGQYFIGQKGFKDYQNRNLYSSSIGRPQSRNDLQKPSPVVINDP